MINRRLVFLLCLSFCLLQSNPAFAAEKIRGAKAETTVMDRDWRKTFELAKNKKDPVAGKLLTWLYVTETDVPVNVATLIKFLNENPDWPRLGTFRDKVEKNIAAARLRPYEVAAWFRQNPPYTYGGLKMFMTALNVLEQEEEARKALSLFWRDAALDKAETAAMMQLYGAQLSVEDFAQRLDEMLWTGRITEAKYMLPFASSSVRKLAEARIALSRRSANAELLLLEVPSTLKNDEGLLFDKARWYRRKDKDDKALAIIFGVKTPHKHLELWWEERNILSRRAIEKRDFVKAHAIANGHGLQEGTDYAQAEWLCGWLELRFLNKPAEAYARFEKLYAHVQSAISRARAAYWAARAAETLGQKEVARQWHERAASFLSTYYGQLSFRRVHGVAEASRYKDVPPSSAAVQAFDKLELVRALRMLDQAGLDRFIAPFLAKIVSLAKDRTDYLLAARLARETGYYYYSVQASKDIQQKLGDFMIDDGYPVLSGLSGQPEKALVHAIVYRESMFDTNAVSTAGARGLMQLMPSTAQSVSKKKKKSFRTAYLTANPAYNLLLGSTYLTSLINDYDGYYPLAIAAYNGGPGNVSKWLDAFGNPATGDIDAVDWVELISNYETRNYVQRVMETYYMYRLKFDQPPKTLRDFGQKKN